MKPFFLLFLATLSMTLSATPSPGAIVKTVDGYVLQYAEQANTLAFAWSAPPNQSQNSLGTFKVTSFWGGLRTEFLLNPSISALNGAQAVFLNYDASADLQIWTLHFSMGSAPVSVSVKPVLNGKRLELTIASNQPQISAIDFGSLPQTLDKRPVSVPYYDGMIAYLPGGNIFTNIYFDSFASGSTRLSGTRADYLSLTDGSYKSLQERFIIAVSNSLNDVFPEIPNAASPYTGTLAGKMIVDVTNGSFDEIAEKLTWYANAGGGNCLAIIHDWQRSGYDNALPAHYPANQQLGGDLALQRAVGSAKSAGCMVSLHENYFDYYPNYDAFSSTAVVRESNGSFMPGWNNGFLQAYVAKPSYMVTNATPESTEIHRRYGTTAGYIDGTSSIFPWYVADMDSSQPNAGQFAGYAAAARNLWNFERGAHAGPVLGEGGFHWYWAGALDGVEAQLAMGGLQKPIGKSAPLFVDFDLLKIHPLQVNHGMGYYSRWTPTGQDFSSAEEWDAYRMQEIAFGHAPFAGGNNWNFVPLLLTEAKLVGPISSRYGNNSVNKIAYSFRGNWVDSSMAMRAGDWSRVQVSYSNQDVITANSQVDPMAVSGYSLPQYGWLAKGNGLLAYTALVNGVIADYSETPAGIFANARNREDWVKASAVAAPVVAGAAQSGPNTLRFAVLWNVYDNIPATNVLTFVHGTTSSGNIAFQCDHSLPLPANQWQPGSVLIDNFFCDLPASVPDGVYQIGLGLYDPVSGRRYPLYGADDGSRRYIVAQLVAQTDLRGNRALRFVSVSPPIVQPDARMNNKGVIVDFGAIRTDGMISLSQVNGVNSLRAYPRRHDVQIQLNSAKLPRPSAVQCDGIATPTAAVGNYWQFHAGGAQVCTW